MPKRLLRTDFGALNGTRHRSGQNPGGQCQIWSVRRHAIYDGHRSPGVSPGLLRQTLTMAGHPHRVLRHRSFLPFAQFPAVLLGQVLHLLRVALPLDAAFPSPNDPVQRRNHPDFGRNRPTYLSNALRVWVRPANISPKTPEMSDTAQTLVESAQVETKTNVVEFSNFRATPGSPGASYWHWPSNRTTTSG